MNAKAYNVARFIVQAFEAEGVEHVFGMPGSHVLSLYDALADSKVRFVSASHENTSAFMAGMYGFLRGKPGVALLTAGPGATNSVSAVAQAYASSLPMVHLTGDVPVAAGPEAFHGVDRRDFLHRIFADVSKLSRRLERAEQIPAALAEAFAVAQSGRPGPVHLSLPIDLSSAPMDPSARHVPSPAPTLQPEPGLVDTIAASLSRAKRCVICVGRGVLVHRAEEELLALAEALGAPVLSTAYGLGAFPQTHPLALGTFSEFSQNAFAFDLIKNADHLLVLGLRPGTDMAKMLGRAAPQGSTFIALDEALAPANHDWNGPTSTCNLRSLLSELLKQRKLFERPAEVAVTTEIARQQQAYERGLAQLLRQHGDKRPLHFGQVMQSLSAELEPDAIVVSGVGNHHVWARNLLQVRRRDSFIAEASWGTMGGELGGGLAAKLVHPNRQVVVVTGDASLLMVAGDLLTAVKERLNLLVVVLNDSRHGIIRGMQRQAFGRSYGDDIAPTDFRKLAESFGIAARRLESPEDIQPALRACLGATQSGPVLLDVVSDYAVPWPKRDALIQAGLQEAETQP